MFQNKTTLGDKSSLEITTAIEKVQQYLLEIQSSEGYWVGELEADASVAAGYIPLMYFMQGKIDPERQRKIINQVRSKQLADGSWGTYYGGPGDLNVTIQVYFALKLGGINADESYMKQAREFVVSHGGIMKANTVTKILLAMFGQFDYRGTPSIPTQLVFLPKWAYFSIYEFASWSRETIMTLILVLATRPVCKVPPSADISELYAEPEGKRRYAPAQWGGLINWRNFFLAADYTLKFFEKLRIQPFHKTALKKVEKWVVEHQEPDGSWGGIMLPWIYALMVLKHIGYDNDHPVIKKGMAGLESFICEGAYTFRLQPATSPVWDTAWTVLALIDSGLPPDHPSLCKAAKWLLKQEIRFKGDWKIKNSKTEPGCWSFEFKNDFYPDIDDTSVVPHALLKVSLQGEDEDNKNAAIERGLNWIKEMQSSDGGWAAFDRDNNKQILANVPYADFMTPLDPTSADVTAHVIELLSRVEPGGHTLKRAISYIKNIQEPDGSWYGRWGVNYIYGTGLTLISLKAAIENPEQEYVRKAVVWLESVQHEDGGWGETCETYENPGVKGKGPSTASQTAWALIGLIGANEQNSPAVRRGIEYLIRHQNEDGSWTEDAFTGTGFPRAFYLRYDMYRIYFPLLALSLYRHATEVV